MELGVSTWGRGNGHDTTAGTFRASGIGSGGATIYFEVRGTTTVRASVDDPVIGGLAIASLYERTAPNVYYGLGFIPEGVGVVLTEGFYRINLTATGSGNSNYFSASASAGVTFRDVRIVPEMGSFALCMVLGVAILATCNRIRKSQRPAAY